MIPYFAYGSNMDPRQMARRCPGARAVGPALLPGHRLVFVWDSPGWGGGVGHVDPDPSSDVWGVLWDLEPHHVEALDGYEQVSDGVYRRETIRVARGPEQVEALIYLVNEPREKAPSARYVAALVRGATAHGLPEDYVRRLRAHAAPGVPS